MPGKPYKQVMKLIDHFLPDFQFNKIHEITVHASAPEVYTAIKELDMSNSTMIRLLFRMRGLPATALTMKGSEEVGFVLLGEEPENELLLGLIGRFWKINGEIHKSDEQTFVRFRKPGFAKAAWNFNVRQLKANKTELSTETRIFCTDNSSYRKFRLYWFLIGPFSGLIRRKILSLIKKSAERRVSVRF